MPATGPSSCVWVRPPPSRGAPSDRYKHACCSYDGYVYMLGGRNTRCLGDFWKYCTVENEWTELKCTGEAAPEELEEHTMVAHEGFLYVFGGLLDSVYTSSRSPLWVFDVVKLNWVHWQGKTSSPQKPTNRKGHSAVVLGANMLLYGGFMSIKGPSQELWSLNLNTMSWVLLSPSEPSSTGPGPRHSHSAVSYQSCMFLFGGLKGLQEQRDFWQWSSTSNVWTCLRNRSGPPRLMGHAAVTFRDSMLVFGGAENPHTPNAFLWTYSFNSGTWSRITCHPLSSAPNRIHLRCAGLGPNYSSSFSRSPTCVLPPRQLGQKARPFQNKCFPAQLSFLEPEGAIELQTFSPVKDSRKKSVSSPSELDCSMEVLPKLDPLIWTSLNEAGRRKRSSWEVDEEGEEQLQQEVAEESGDIRRTLPDVLLVLGGKPHSKHTSVSMWQMTLKDPDRH